MEFTWKRFGAFMLLGILVAAANIGLIYLGGYHTEAGAYLDHQIIGRFYESLLYFIG